MAQATPTTALPFYLTPFYLEHREWREANVRHAERIAADPHLYCPSCEELLTRGWCDDCCEGAVA